MSLDLPVHGDANWDVKLNSALTQIYDQVVSLVVATNALNQTVQDLSSQIQSSTAVFG